MINLDLINVEILFSYKESIIKIMRHSFDNGERFLSFFIDDNENSIIRKKTYIICKISAKEINDIKQNNLTFYNCFKNNEIFIYCDYYENYKLPYSRSQRITFDLAEMLELLPDKELKLKL